MLLKSSLYPFIGKVISNIFLQIGRRISGTTCRYLDQEYRKAKGLPLNPNKEKVLLELPDYSFLDGRPVPYGTRQKLRIMKQRQYSEKIIELTKEIDFAMKNYQQRISMKQKEKEQILKNKLERKGEKNID